MSESAIICLNGPNILELSLSDYFKRCDCIAVGSGILNQQIIPKYYFYESTSSLDIEYLNGNVYDPYYALFLVLEPLQLNALIERSRTNNIEVITNPQPFASYFVSPSKNLQHFNPHNWYSCDETTFISGHRASQNYLVKRLWEKGILLNYRCTLIKAFTLALVKGYKNIYIAGMNPSSPHHWFSENTDKASRVTYPSIDEKVMMQLYNNSHNLIRNMPLANNDDASIGYVNKQPKEKRIPNIFFAFISSLLYHCPDLASMINIKIMGNDPDVNSYLDRYKLNHLKY